jgi:hypothetical protein
MRLAKEGHFQKACDRTFEGVHGEVPDKLIEHPNEYIAAAMEIHNRQKGTAGTPPVANGSRSSTTSNLPGTPLTGAGTPGLGTPFTGNSAQDRSFVRTPINITPMLGGHGRSSSGTTPPPSASATAASPGGATDSGAQLPAGAGTHVGSPIGGIVTDNTAK